MDQISAGIAGATRPRKSNRKNTNDCASRSMNLMILDPPARSSMLAHMPRMSHRSSCASTKFSCNRSKVRTRTCFAETRCCCTIATNAASVSVHSAYAGNRSVVEVCMWESLIGCEGSRSSLCETATGRKGRLVKFPRRGFIHSTQLLHSTVKSSVSNTLVPPWKPWCLDTRALDGVP